MKVRRARNVPLWTALLATLVAGVLAYVNAQGSRLHFLDALEGLSIDARFRLRGGRPPSTDRIVIVAVDDATRAADPELMQTRRGYARLLDALTRYRPKVVAIDLFFSSPEEILPRDLATRVRDLAAAAPPALPDPAGEPYRAAVRAVAEELRGDDLLAAAIARNGRVMLGAFLTPGEPPAAPAEPPGLERARHGQVADAGAGGALRPLTGHSLYFSLPALAAHAFGAGLVNTLRDDDGVSRRMPLAMEYGGRHYMPLGLAVALVELGQPAGTRYIAGRPTIDIAGTQVPLTTAASLALDPLGPHRFARVSAIDVITGAAAASALEGKLVFIGHTYSAADKMITSLDPAADGGELHATLAENLLGGRILRSTGPLATVLATLLLGLVISAAQLRRIRRRPYVPPLVAVAAITAYVALAFALFASGTVIGLAPPVLLAAVVLLAATVGGLATEGREKAHLRAVFSQYVSRPVVDRILADPARAKLGGERKELTVLFSDIRGFSLVAEGMPPEELAGFLHEYLSPMTDLVLASGGMLDKYIGDAIMAIWGAPVDTLDHAARACEVALRMHETLATLNRTWATVGKPPVAIGIGINTGAMAVGNMGSAARFEYTVLGDQVNLGSRLEALTKEYGVGILVGEATAKAAGDAFRFREIDLVRVKGRAKAIPVFELVGRAGAQDPAFARALALYRARDFAAAGAGFATLREDPAAAVMAARCAELAIAPPPAAWDGVYEQRSK